MADNVTVDNADLTDYSVATDDDGDGHNVQLFRELGVASVGDGRKTVTTAGTAEQFTSQACKWVEIIAEEDNTDVVVVGGSTVVAALATRRGKPLFAAQSAVFKVKNMDLLYML